MKTPQLIALPFIFALATPVLAQPGHEAGRQARSFEHVDANADGKVSADELGTLARSRLTKLDLNRDGKISREEATQVQAQRRAQRQDKRAERLRAKDADHNGSWSRSELQRMPDAVFAKLDKNADGVLTQAELDAARAARTTQRGEHAQRFFDKLDANRDGYVDGQELVSVAQRRLAKLDANGDGVVQQQEWKTGRHGRGMGGHERGNQGKRTTEKG